MGEGVTKPNDYVVLARKYRPRNFGELYGQDALVRTLTNAIKAGKVHHAYVLTGIRGVGKTTTARIIAKALNCAGGPAVEWDEADPQVQAIAAGTHMDVFEYDAASNRKAEEVAQLFEGIAYAPVSGRYKVYIIDEVHMLSNTAFNSLLKTLEEPPPNVKFIFATTEVNKIPVTVLSRCQRFDLKRIPSETLVTLLTDILGKEGIVAEPAAVQMVARAADGSARDGLSLLDQAIALSQGDSPEVKASVVQAMLGLADRAQLYDVLETTLGGSVEASLALLDDLYARGQDAMGIVQGLLEMVHLLTRLKVVPGLPDSAALTELERTRAVPLAAKVGKANLSRLYQMLVQCAGEVKEASRPYEALSMALVRMAYLAPLPSLDQLVGQAQAAVAQAAPVAVAASVGAAAVQEVRRAAEVPVVAMAAPWEAGGDVDAGGNRAEAAALPADWKGVVGLVRAHKPGLAAALGQQVRCLGLQGTEMTVQVERGLHLAKDLVRDLRTVLHEVTGVRWQVEQQAADEGAVMPRTLVEEAHAHAQQEKDEVAADPAVREALAMFPGAEIELVEAH